MIYIICFLLGHLQFGYTYAPELIQGATLAIETEAARIAYIDGGNWQALQIGKDEGRIYRIHGAEIDNNNAPVAFEWETRPNNKKRGVIDFRGHNRKLCYAPLGKDLPCR